MDDLTGSRKMKMFFVLMVCVLLLVAGAVIAGEEAIFDASGGTRLFSGTSGPASLLVAANGNATIKFMWLKLDGTTAAGDVKRFDPVAEFGESTYALRSEFGPRKFVFPGVGAPDSVALVLESASEVILTW